MRVYTRKQLRALLGNVSDSTIWRMEKAGLLPPSFQLTRRYRGYDADKVDEMLRERADQQGA